MLNLQNEHEHGKMQQFRTAIFCKSFEPDFERLEQLIQSYNTFVDQAVPFLVSVPEDHIKQAEARFRPYTRVTLVSDEEYSGVSYRQMGGWVHQQFCKLMVHRTGFADSYFTIDSDSYFIDSFGASDFTTGAGVPRIVASQVFTGYNPYNGPLLAAIEHDDIPEHPLVEPLPEPDRPRLDLASLREAALQLPPGASPGERSRMLDLVFPAGLRTLAFMPSQFMLADALAAMEADLKDSGSSFQELLALIPWEYIWYGCYCLHVRPVRCAPSMSPTICFVSQRDIDDAKGRGINHAKLSRHFSSVTMAARHLDAMRLE